MFQSACLLKLLLDQGMLQMHLDTVFHALLSLSKIQYALSAWDGFLTRGISNAFLRRMYKYHFINVCLLYTSDAADE